MVPPPLGSRSSRYGSQGRAIAPAGASTGSGKVIERCDGGFQFDGHDVVGAIGAIKSEIAPTLKGMDVREQIEIEHAAPGVEITVEAP